MRPNVLMAQSALPRRTPPLLGSVKVELDRNDAAGTCRQNVAGRWFADDISAHLFGDFSDRGLGPISASDAASPVLSPTLIDDAAAIRPLERLQATVLPTPCPRQLQPKSGHIDRPTVLPH